MWFWNHLVERASGGFAATDKPINANKLFFERSIDMSFLDNLKKKRAAEKAAAEKPAEAAVPAVEPEEEQPVKKANPLAALKAKKKAPEGEAPKGGSSLLERMKAKKKAQEEEKTEEKIEEKEELKEEKKPSLQERAEAIVAEKLQEAKEEAPAVDDPAVVDAENEADKKAEEKAEAEAEEAKPEAVAEETDDTEEEKPAEEKTEEKPKKRRRRRKSAEKSEEMKETEEASEEEPTEDKEDKKPAKKQDIKVHEYVANYDILGKKVSYDDMAGAVMDYFIDDNWKAIQDELTEKMNAIRIEPDMNPGTLKYALAELNNLNDEISAAYVEQKQILDMLTDKEFGAATAIMAMNQKGANSEERKANGFAALTRAKFGGEEEVNLIALINAVKARFVFLNSLSKRIQYKSNTCITMSGAMKMEASLMA